MPEVAQNAWKLVQGNDRPIEEIDRVIEAYPKSTS